LANHNLLRESGGSRRLSRRRLQSLLQKPAEAAYELFVAGVARVATFLAITVR